MLLNVYILFCYRKPDYLRQKKYREHENAFIAEGPKVAEELLLSAYTVSKLFAVEEYAKKSIRAENLKDKTVIISEATLKKISALTTPNQVLAVAEIPKREINYTAISKSLSLALDGVSDP